MTRSTSGSHSVGADLRNFLDRETFPGICESACPRTELSQSCKNGRCLGASAHNGTLGSSLPEELHLSTVFLRVSLSPP